jgi:hypothetical protein
MNNNKFMETFGLKLINNASVNINGITCDTYNQRDGINNFLETKFKKNISEKELFGYISQFKSMMDNDIVCYKIINDNNDMTVMAFTKQGNSFIIAINEYTSIIVDYDELQQFVVSDKQIYLIQKCIKLKT